MLVCHCAGVRDTRVLDAIERGSASCEAIAAACGAGARCGGCRPLLELLLDQRERRARISQRDLTADAASA
ncbi:MAG TPA: (2Fe-2S)-binding protein [Myxococcota bacterium]|nr:(2Fe-2S)-binding protein [Myxococcota bacterium]